VLRRCDDTGLPLSEDERETVARWIASADSGAELT
jgi:hypothetical protein